MTQEEKAKAYSGYEDILPYAKADFENIFPELKESEDKKIRNWVIDGLKFYANAIGDEEGLNDALSWLEKQGELQNKLINYRNYLIYQTERWSKKEHDKTNNKIGTQDCIGHANAFISARAEFEEMFDYDSWNEKQGEQKPANKVEPKFKKE